jgi:diacylglycerol kinase family enzyme
MAWAGPGQDALLVAVPALALAVVLVLGMLLRARGRAAGGEEVAPESAPAEERAAARPWAAVVANPTKVTDVDTELTWLEDRSLALGWAAPVWLETTVEDPGGGQARTAVAAGASAVLAYGGDGTVRAVAAEVAGTGVPLGLLPAGTGNLLARNLSVPLLDLDAALLVALSGRDRAIDVGRVVVDVSGEDQAPRQDTFMVMAGLGFDAEVMARVEPRLKARVGWWAYVVTGLRNLRGRRTKVVLRMDGQAPVHRRVRSVIVGNCGELTGGVRLMPQAEVDDGWLDVVLVAPGGVAGWATVTGAVLTRSRFGHPVVEHFRCQEIEVRAEKPLQVQVDGDPIGEARLLQARVDPHALVVRT